jgi:hypothetical protein
VSVSSRFLTEDLRYTTSTLFEAVYTPLITGTAVAENSAPESSMILKIDFTSNSLRI